MNQTLEHVRILEGVGFTREQSEASVKVLNEVMDDKFATKHDFHLLRSDMKNMELRFENKLNALKNELTIRMVVGAASIIGILSAVIKL